MWRSGQTHEEESAHRRVLDAETMASKWLADGNAAREAGNRAKAEKCYAKAQYWLDRYNVMAGRT